MERIIKGIWIPIEIWQDRSLSWNEKILLMEIDSFTSKGHECYISNDYIAELLGVSVRWAIKCLSHLIETGYIRVVKFDGRKRYVESTIQFNADMNKSSMQSGTKVQHTNNNEYINKERDNKGRTHFQKPSVSEVAAFCRERNNGIDPEEFVAFYESKGWMVGRNPMKDWKSAVITWEKAKKREKEIAPRKREKRQESVFEHNLKVMDQMFGTNLHEQTYGNGGQADEQ